MQPRRRRAPRGSGDQLRGEIIAAARDVLAQHGSADAVSIRAVAAHAGVTPPSIYLHFADKDALLDAVAADLFAHIGEAMRVAAEGVEHPLERLRRQGLACVRFARENAEVYRLAMMSMRTEAGDADEVIGTSAFQQISATIRDCMDAGIFAEGDPLPIALELWAAAHGIASLLIAKPYLPWGEPELVAERVLRAAALGHAVADLIGDPDVEKATAWLKGQPAG
ncbi:MAG TPA: TetR/AcrR family transcriptional regulator [Jatrophihabitantaceae bacterium]|nr:TetR/AcrR family transcriptional regulator [Jatrophihabitantaceae bacterium]